MEWPLIGRQAELEVLSAALADTRASGVVLAGEAGIGKTRLARETLARAEGQAEVEWLAATRAAASGGDASDTAARMARTGPVASLGGGSGG